jgi:hypothetical protein
MAKSVGAVRLSEAQLQEHIAAGLENIRHLCSVYDSGHPYISFSLATEVYRVLCSNPVVVRLRGTKEFTSPVLPGMDDPNVLTPRNKLVGVQFGGDPPILNYLPAFLLDRPRSRPLPFREWWNRDVIYRAGAGKHGLPADVIPAREEDQVSHQDRQTLVRREFVEQMRNKLGAHMDEEIPEVLEDLQKAAAFGAVFSIQTPTGEFSTARGNLPIGAGAAAAMMRQIAEEVLVAYGLR